MKIGSKNKIYERAALMDQLNKLSRIRREKHMQARKEMRRKAERNEYKTIYRSFN